MSESVVICSYVLKVLVLADVIFLNGLARNLAGILTNNQTIIPHNFLSAVCCTGLLSNLKIYWVTKGWRITPGGGEAAFENALHGTWQMLCNLHISQLFVMFIIVWMSIKIGDCLCEAYIEYKRRGIPCLRGTGGKEEAVMYKTAWVILAKY